MSPQVDPQTERAKSILRHRAYLASLRGAPGSYELGFHVWIAGALRTLLLDDTYGPVLLDFAAEAGRPLTIYGPRPANSPAHPDVVFLFTALIASFRPEPGSHQMTIGEYLDTPLGTTAGFINPRRLINEIANGEGAAHLGFKKSEQLTLLKSSQWSSGEVAVAEVELARIMGQLADWVIATIDDMIETGVLAT